MSEIVSCPTMAGSAVPACPPADHTWRDTPPTEQQLSAHAALRRAAAARSRLVRGSFLQCLPVPIVNEILDALTVWLPSCEVCGRALVHSVEIFAGTCPADEFSDAHYVFGFHNECNARLGNDPNTPALRKIRTRAKREFKRCYLAATGEGGAR